MLLSSVSFSRSIRTGEDVLLSTADKIASPLSKPLIFLPKTLIDCSIESPISFGKQSLTFQNVHAPFMEGVVSPSDSLTCFLQKS